MPHVEYQGSDGSVWPSATQLTQLLPKAFLWSWYKSQVKKYGWDGWLKCNATSELGKSIGTEVHSLVECLVKKEDGPSASYPASITLADALYMAVNPLVEEYVAIEPHLVSETLKLHGTADIIVRLNYRPGLWVGDWKTSYHKSTEHPIQLAVYAYAWNEQHPDQLIDQGFIARVDKESVNKNVKIDEYIGLKKYFPVLKSLRVIWDFMNHQGDWIK